MPFKQYFELVKDDIYLVQKYLKEFLSLDDVKIINDSIEHLTKNKGKFLRPALSLLVYKALLSDNKHKNSYNNIRLISSVNELIHIATLLHDDVIDESSMRRGIETINNKYSNSIAVLVGDYIYTKAFQILSEIENINIIKLYCETINVVAMGELMQLESLYNLKMTHSRYNDIIYRKTAKLFETSCIAPLILNNTDIKIMNQAKEYGLRLGIAFQIVDDLLDYSADIDNLGKNLGDDLKEGKITLPLIYLYEVGNKDDKKLVEQISKKDVKNINFEFVKERLELNNCIKMCKDRANEELTIAYNSIINWPDTLAKDSLLALLGLISTRCS